MTDMRHAVRRWFATAMAACALLGGRVSAQPAAGAPDSSAAPTHRTHVLGAVTDSLRGGVLAGATVRTLRTPEVAITDSAGAFRLGTVPAPSDAFVIDHPLLDSLGLFGLTVRAGRRAPHDSLTIHLSTPSVATVRRRVCADRLPRAGDVMRSADDVALGAMYGEVRNAFGGVRLAGADVVVQWVAVDTSADHLAARQGTRAVRTDSTGAWRVCDLPIGVPLEWQVAAAGVGSGRTAVVLDRALPLGRLDLWIGVPAIARAGSPQAPRTETDRERVAEAPALGVVRGVVRDSTGAPREGVRITLAQASADRAGRLADDAGGGERERGAEARTGADGRFTLAGVPLGTQSLVVRALGYAPTFVTAVVRPDAPTVLDVPLQRVVTLERITAWARGGRIGQLFTDIAQRNRLGKSLSANVAIYNRTGDLTATLRAMPYAFMEGGPALARAMRPAPGRVKCEPLLLVDGDAAAAAANVNLMRPEDVIAIEFFRPNMLSPRWYGGFEAHPCEVVAFYTERWGTRRLR